MADQTERQCHVCEEWTTEWEIDRDTLLNSRHTRPICHKCMNAGTINTQQSPFARSLAPVAPYQRSSESSRDGAKAAQCKVEGQALQVLAHLVEAGPDGLIEPQITFLTDFPRTDSTRAINGLWQKSPYVEKADFKRVNPVSGVMVQVYVATDAGRAFIAQSRQGKAA